MHVLHYAPAPVRGGLLDHVEILCRGLVRHGLQVDAVLSPAPAIDPVASDLQTAGIMVHRLSVAGKGDLQGMRALRHLIAARHPDLAHVHLSSPVESLPALLAARAGGARILTTEHAPTFHPLRRYYSAAAKRWVGRRLEAVVAVCRSDAEFLMREFGVPAGLVRVIPNGVPRLEGAQDAAEARRRLGLPDGEGLLVGYAGRLEARKGIGDLLEAARLAGDGLRALVFAGDGPMEEELRAATGPGPEIRVLGRLDGIGTFLAAVDVFVLPSHGEAMPLALLQAMRAGQPILATRVGGIPEAIEDGRNGLLVPPGRPPLLAAALARLRKEPALRRRLGEAARADGDERFSDERMIREIERLYRGLRPAGPGESPQMLDR